MPKIVQSLFFLGMILVWVLGTFSLVCSAWDNSGSLGPPHMVEVEYRYPGSREDYRGKYVLCHSNDEVFI